MSLEVPVIALSYALTCVFPTLRQQVIFTMQRGISTTVYVNLHAS